MLIDFNEYELGMIRESLHYNVKSLESYIAWVDDRPMLPNAEIAIDKMRVQIKEYYDLILKIYDAKN